MYYSKSTGGFYDTAIHGDNIPADAVEITTEEHAALMQVQSEGKQIVSDKNGYPIAIGRSPDALTREDVESLRLLAYADPITGSDRYFAEAASMDAAGKEGGDEMRELGLTRRAEIQAIYQWPK